METKQDKKDLTKGGLIAGGALTVAGLSMLPSALSFRKAYKAGGKGKLKLTDAEAAKLVSNYLRGAQRFGKSIPGLVNRGVSKVVRKFKDETFGDTHLRMFTAEKPQKAFDFWLGTEALGKTKGRLDTVAKEILGPEGTAKALSTAIEKKHIRPKTLKTMFSVPTYSPPKKPQKTQKPLEFLNKRYKKDQDTIKSVKKYMSEARGSIYDKIENTPLMESKEVREAIRRMALDKQVFGAPEAYAKKTMYGTIGLTGAGAATAGTSALLDNKKS